MSQEKTELTAEKLKEYIDGDRSQQTPFTDSQGYQWFNLSLNPDPDKPIIREKKTPTETEDTSLSTINLEKEFIFYVAHKIHTFNKTIGDQSDAAITDAQFQDILFGQIKEDGKRKDGLIDSIRTQVSSIFEDTKLSPQEKKLALDELRETIQNQADSALQAQFKLPEGTNVKDFTEQFNHNSENTPAFGKPITIIQINPNKTVDVLETAKQTAHEYDAGKDTTAKLSRYKYDPDNLEKLPTPLYSTYRTDILVPHSKTYKGQGDVESKQIQATIDKINNIAGKFNGDSPIFYNLFTSIHSRLRIGEKKNEQTPRLKILLKAQDAYNLSLAKLEAGNGTGAGVDTEAGAEEKVGKKYFFTLNIPTNGFGYEPSPSFFSSEATEMALRNDMAIAMILGTDEQKKALIGAYQTFLEDPKRPDFIHKSKQDESIKVIVNQIKSNTPEPEPEPFKKTLSLLYKNNLHYKHQYARLAQTMAMLCEEQSINGCKSGAERTAGILGRVEQAEELKTKISTIQADENKTEVERAQAISKAIDDAYNKKGIYGISSDISLSDQGAVSKIETQLPYLSNLNPINWFINIARYFINIIDTNRAEPSTMNNIQNSKTGSMQAHKVKGFDEMFFSEVKKLNPTITEVSSHTENGETTTAMLNRKLGATVPKVLIQTDEAQTSNALETSAQSEKPVQQPKTVTIVGPTSSDSPESSFHPGGPGQ